MNEPGPVLAGFTAEYQSVIDRLLTYFPNVALAILVLLLGWLLAAVSRLLLVRAMTSLDRFWQYLAVKLDQRYLLDYRSPTKFLGQLLFWLIILITLLLVTDILELKIFRDWLTSLMAFLPLVAGSALLLFVGFLGSILVRDIITRASDTADLPHGQFMGRIAQALILVVAIILCFDQLGLDIAFLSVIIGITLASILGSVGLAFGLGAQHQVSNMLAAKQIMNSLEVGDTVRIGDIEGVVTDIGASNVSVEKDQTLIIIPAALFDSQITFISKKGGGA